jgi:hypothetical protein
MSIPLDNETFLTARLVQTETMIVAIETAILVLATGSQSYSFDTGQTRQTVTKADLGSLRLLLKELEERRDKLRSQLGLGSPGLQTRVIPGW